MRLVLAFVLALAACAADEVPSNVGPDAATPDAGAADAGAADAGATDAGNDDAGRTDAGPSDAGVADAGPVDAGEPDAGGLDGGASPDCSGLTDGAGDVVLSLELGGLERSVRVHIPPKYDRSRRMPLVLVLHGIQSSGDEMVTMTRLSALADEEGFIVAYPNGVNAREMSQLYVLPEQRSWNAGACCGASQYYGVDDVAFVDASLAELERRLCIDPKRTFATGLSNGGMLAYRLACERADRFAAISSVSGVNVFTGCEPSRAVPLLHFHGTGDTVVPFYGSLLYQSAASSVADFAEHNGCEGPDTVTYENGDTRCVTTGGCTPADATVTLCTISFGGHNWPGGPLIFNGLVSRDIDASRESWKFFEAHPLP